MTDSSGSQLPPSAPPTAPFSPPPRPPSRAGTWLLALGCLGFLVLAGLGVVVLVALGAKDGGPVSIEDAAVLKMSIGGALPDHVRRDGLEELFESKPISVLEHRSNLRKAAADKRIKGVLLKLEPFEGGWAKVEELRAALETFKQSGKFVIAYAEYLTEKEYALALAADTIIMPPDAPFEFNGIAAEVSHYPGLLEKLGVEVQYFRYGKYKSVSGESYGRKALTEPVKEMIEENLDRVFGHFVDAVAKYRKLDAQAVRALVEEGRLKADWAKEQKLIDTLAYWDEVEAQLKDKVGAPKDKPVPFVSSGKYLDVSASAAGLPDSQERIGLVVSQGLIVAGAGGSDPLGGEGTQGSTPLIAAIRKGLEDTDVKAIILRVDSPGGAGLGCDYVRREIEQAREKKPIIVSMSDVAASGGYWVSMDATAIVAHPTTATGSIGIFAVVPSLAGTYEKLGLNNEVFRRGAHADAINGSRLMSQDEAKRFDDDLHGSYQRFVELAAKGRKKSVEDMEQVAQGRTWYGDAALERGLVDKLGGMDEAIALAKEKAGLPADKFVALKLLEKRRSWVDELLQGSRRDDDEPQANAVLVEKVVAASGLGPLLRQVPVLGAFTRQVLAERQTVFPLMETRVDWR